MYNIFVTCNKVANAVKLLILNIFVIRKDDSEQDYFKWSIVYVPSCY